MWMSVSIQPLMTVTFTALSPLEAIVATVMKEVCYVMMEDVTMVRFLNFPESFE